MNASHPPAPERIHGWLNSQLSGARRFGSCTYHGANYIVAYNEPGQPLVRVDVLQAEAKVNREAAKAAKEVSKRAAQAAQKDLL